MKKDITGQRFDSLTALYPTEKKAKGGYIIWVCRCDCGNLVERSLKQLKCYERKKWKSCKDCWEKRNSERHTSHGDTNSRLYSVHSTMLQRCENKNAHEYHNYGGRGIKVCDEWHDYEKFKSWALENGYVEAKQGVCTLDRIDTNKGYAPENCRWVSMKHQQRNRRNNIRLTYKGTTKCLSQWAEELGVKYITMYKRYTYGWSTEEILFGR